jgi:UDP-N-acetylmuramate--alanine ligase
VLYHGQLFGHFQLPFVGKHLVFDSLAVIGVGILKQLSAQQIEKGICDFTGVKRRFVIEKVKDDILVDDYAHHPTEVGVTLDTARMRWPNRKIVAVFKPHRAGRLLHFADDFASQLKKADVICLCEFTSIDDQQDGVNIDINYLAQKLPGSLVFHETDADAKVLASFAPAVFVFMSSKDIYPFKEKLKKLL